MTGRLLGVWPDRSPEWLAARDGRIGASDVGVICGWSPYMTRADLAAERVHGRPDAPEVSAAKRTRGARPRGAYLEPAVRAWLADRAEVAYDDYRSTGTWVGWNDADDWQMVNPDAVTTTGELCEFKTCDVRDLEHGWGRAGGPDVPITYAAQCHWGMGVLGLPVTLLAVLSGAPRFEFALYRIKFDPNVFDYLSKTAAAFLAEVTSQKEHHAQH